MSSVGQSEGENPLDVQVGRLWKSLADSGVPRPDVLVNLATGLDLLPERLSCGQEVRLGDHAELPASLEAARLFHGSLREKPQTAPERDHDPFAETRVWVVLDGSLEPRLPNAMEEAPWTSLLPIWLAAKAGASFLLHASAGVALNEAIEPGSLALIRDHVNFGAPSPLSGLGMSELGPLFPDTTHLHSGPVRALAQQVAQQRGLSAFEAVAACIPSPQLCTPAECEFFRRAGTDLVVQGLAAPLLAAAHAGLSVLSVAAVLDGPGGVLDVRAMLERAESTAPALEELLLVVGGSIGASGLLEDSP